MEIYIIICTLVSDVCVITLHAVVDGVIGDEV